jgi:hypothetical protein
MALFLVLCFVFKCKRRFIRQTEARVFWLVHFGVVHILILFENTVFFNLLCVRMYITTSIYIIQPPLKIGTTKIISMTVYCNICVMRF